MRFSARPFCHHLDLIKTLSLKLNFLESIAIECWQYFLQRLGRSIPRLLQSLIKYRHFHLSELRSTFMPDLPDLIEWNILFQVMSMNLLYVFIKRSWRAIS